MVDAAPRRQSVSRAARWRRPSTSCFSLAIRERGFGRHLSAGWGLGEVARWNINKRSAKRLVQSTFGQPHSESDVSAQHISGARLRRLGPAAEKKVIALEAERGTSGSLNYR